MSRYQQVLRALFAVIFIAGGLVHFVLGRLLPAGYAGFGETALIPWLRALWASFVMPNLAWLTILLGCYEIACGVGMIWRRTVTLAVVGMLGFLVFITIVGYGYPAASPLEDLVKNRLVTIIMAGLLVPLLIVRNRQTNATTRGPTITGVLPDANAK